MFILLKYNSHGVGVHGVSVYGVISVRGVCVLEVSVWRVHVRGGGGFCTVPYIVMHHSQLPLAATEGL